MVFTLGLRHTFLCTSSGAGVSLAIRDSNSTASFRAVTYKPSVRRRQSFGTQSVFHYSPAYRLAAIHSLSPRHFALGCIR